MTELSALASPHGLTSDHTCAFCSYPGAGSGLPQKTSGSWGRCPVPGAPSRCPRSLPLLGGYCSVSPIPTLCPAVSPQGDTNRISASRSMYSNTDLHISGLVSMWASMGLSKSFQSQPTLIITLPKGSLSSRGENLVSGRCSPSSPGWGISRMACIFLSLGPQSHPLGHHVRPPDKRWDQPLSNPLWLPRWFKVSHLLLLPAPSQLSFRCSPNFCCVPLWLLICTASVTIAKQNMNMSVSSLIFSTIYTLTAFGVRSKHLGTQPPGCPAPIPTQSHRPYSPGLLMGEDNLKPSEKHNLGVGSGAELYFLLK